MKRFIAMLLLAAFVRPALGQDAAQTLRADVEALTAQGHRLAGTDAGAAAAAYIEKRLGDAGIEQVYRLDMPLVQTQVKRCDVQVGGKTVELLPMRPNVHVPPVTAAEGLTAEMIYAGNGLLSAYGGRDPEGKIVVLEEASFNAWEDAMTLGAAAVVFLEGQKPITSAKHAPVPANFLRFYATTEAQQQVDFRTDHADVTLTSQITWANAVGSNVLAFIPGSAPVFDAQLGQAEMLVLAANYDSFGYAPRKSPDATGAANVAALLRTAQRLREAGLKRDVLVCFFDNHARSRQGSRTVYAALHMTAEEHEGLQADHIAERRYVEQALAMLNEPAGQFPPRPDRQSAAEAYAQYMEIRGAIIEAFRKAAEHRRDDMNRAMSNLRLRQDRDEAATQQRVEALKAEMAVWDEARRALRDANRPEFDKIDAAVNEAMWSQVRDGLHERQGELALLSKIDQQRTALRTRLADRWVSLHVDYQFMGDGPLWGVAIGDDTQHLISRANSGTDKVGYYTRVMEAFRRGAEATAALDHLDIETFKDPWYGKTFVSTQFVSDGIPAGFWGIYNVSLVTGFDRFDRRGHASDTLATLDLQRIDTFADEADRWLTALADEPSLTVARQFQSVGQSQYPEWSNNKLEATGHFAGLRISGSLKEKRPASDAVVAMYAIGNSDRGWPWEPLKKAEDVADYDPCAIQPADANGHFALVGIANDMYRYFVAVGATFDDRGGVATITSKDTLINDHAGLSSKRRLDMFPATAHVLAFPWMSEPAGDQIKVNQAISDAPYRDSRQLRGHAKQSLLGFFYAPQIARSARVKAYHKEGMVMLNVTDQEPIGVGYLLGDFVRPSNVNAISARDIWQLNEQRLRVMRSRGITEADLETLHGKANLALERADKSSDMLQKHAALAESYARSQRLHPRLRGAMNDLVRAIVILLLLAIPFSFALERLLVGATSIYGRLGAFAIIFAITFAVLYVLHPGFAIAATPTIIFLAFIIVLLSGLVIYIVVRKFRSELRAAQGQSTRVHDVEMSRMGTLIAAANMGISTMRRRPLRTALTAVTVIMLTFTILCFATFGSQLGIARTYEGPIAQGQTADVFLRRLDYQAMDRRLLDVLEARAGDGGYVATQWWLARRNFNDTPYTVVNVKDGQTMIVEGVMGVDPAEFDRWPAYADIIDGVSAADRQQALADDGVFLPRVIRDELALEVGDVVRVRGRRAVFAGVTNANVMQQLKHLDGDSILPVDFADASMQQTDEDRLAAQMQDDMDLTQRDFVRLSPDQIMVASADFVRRSGGRLHVINMYKPEDAAASGDGAIDGDEIAELATISVWAQQRNGIYRLVFTSLTELSGGFAIVVPVVLGGLIIFGTMLGSIADREKEIYTFSALGLAPAHVGLLFFAEAAVYAVVGGMGGQILAQAVMAVAARLAEAGIIDQPEINFSSTNALFAMALVMATVMVSAIYPAIRASRSANPGLARTWRMPTPEGDDLKMVFPFTVSAYDITGVVSYLAEHFRAHDDAGLGVFASRDVNIGRSRDSGDLRLSAELALAPFDLGVTQSFTLTATPSEIPGVDEVAIHAHRLSGSSADWRRANKVFLHDLRKQFLLWRTLSHDMIEHYRGQTLMTLGEHEYQTDEVDDDHAAQPHQPDSRLEGGRA